MATAKPKVQALRATADIYLGATATMIQAHQVVDLNASDPVVANLMRAGKLVAYPPSSAIKESKNAAS